MDGIEGLLSLPRHSVDMLLTDPPYGTTKNYWDVPLPLDALWEAVRWAVKPNGAALFFAQCPYDKVLGASNLAMLRYEWIWYNCALKRLDWQQEQAFVSALTLGYNELEIQRGMTTSSTAIFMRPCGSRSPICSKNSLL